MMHHQEDARNTQPCLITESKIVFFQELSLNQSDSFGLVTKAVKGQLWSSHLCIVIWIYKCAITNGILVQCFNVFFFKFYFILFYLVVLNAFLGFTPLPGLKSPLASCLHL